MNNNKTLIFIILAISYILSILIKPYSFSWLVKILPILFLITVAWQHCKFRNESQPHRVAIFFITGLLFSSCGDFLLDNNTEDWFIFGLGAFFIAHVCYLITLRPFNIRLTNKRAAILGIYLAFGLMMFLKLIDGLGELFIPVLAYMTVLLLMALATVFTHRSNAWLVAGGISFVLSDSLIGFDKFNSPILLNHVWVMCSYYFAQYALVKGYLRSLEIA